MLKVPRWFHIYWYHHVVSILADQVRSGMSGASSTTSRQVSLTLWECQTLKGKCCESTMAISAVRVLTWTFAGELLYTEPVLDVFHRPGDFKPACKVLTSVCAFAFWVCGLEIAVTAYCTVRVLGICCDRLLHCESARRVLGICCDRLLHCESARRLLHCESARNMLWKPIALWEC